MPTPEHIERVFASYAEAMTANDFAAAVALYAHDAVVRDPVDGAPLVGDEQILGFFSAGAGVLQDLTLTGPVRVAGDGRQAAAPLRARVDVGEGVKTLDTIDVMTFDDAGRITSMDAYYGPSNVHDP